jgi:hypothetical protein
MATSENNIIPLSSDDEDIDTETEIQTLANPGHKFSLE